MSVCFELIALNSRLTWIRSLFSTSDLSLHLPREHTCSRIDPRGRRRRGRRTAIDTATLFHHAPLLHHLEATLFDRLFLFLPDLSKYQSLLSLEAFELIVLNPSSSVLEPSLLRPSHRIPSLQSTTLSSSFQLDNDSPPTPSNPSPPSRRILRNRRRSTSPSSEGRRSSLSRSSTPRAEPTALDRGKGSRRRRL